MNDQDDFPDNDDLDVTFTPEQEAWYQAYGLRQARLQARLGEPDPNTVMNYTKLRHRAGRLVRLCELRAPSIIISKECQLVAQALDSIDPSWREKAPEWPETA